MAALRHNNYYLFIIVFEKHSFLYLGAHSPHQQDQTSIIQPTLPCNPSCFVNLSQLS